GEENFFSTRLGECAQALLAQPPDRPAGGGAGGVGIIYGEGEGALEQRLGRVLALDRAEARAGAEADAGNHLAGFAQTPSGQRICGAERLVGSAERDRGGGGFEKIAA